MKKRKLPNWKFLGLGAAVALVLGIGIWFILTWNSGKPTYDYIQVGRGAMKVSMRESAIIGPEHRLNVTPPIPGRLDSIKVSNGEAVKQGQVLAWISSTERAALMDSARAAGGKEVEFWQDVYKPAPLIAPLDGHIISTAVVPGQVVVAAQTVFTMSDHLIVQANVDETDLSHVKLGQNVDVTFDSFPDTHLSGKVHEIAYDATTVNSVTTYLVNIYPDSLPDYIRSGISANVFFRISDRPDVLRIPTNTLTADGQVLVITAPGATPELKKIKTGESDGAWIEVTDGLSEGDWIARRNFNLQKASGAFSFTAKAQAQDQGPRPGSGRRQ